MPKRVSIKGRGADLFFGEYTSGTTSSLTTDTLPVAAPEHGDLSDDDLLEPDQNARKPQRKNTSKRDSQTDGLPHFQKARLPEGTLARMTEGRSIAANASLKEPGEPVTAILDSLWADLEAPATVKNSFRYNDTELSSLVDAVYALFKSYRVRMSKQDLARLGLIYVLWDYKTRGTNSLLAHYTKRRAVGNKDQSGKEEVRHSL